MYLSWKRQRGMKTEIIDLKLHVSYSTIVTRNFMYCDSAQGKFKGGAAAAALSETGSIGRPCNTPAPRLSLHYTHTHTRTL